MDQANVKAGLWDDAIEQAKADGYDGLVYENTAEGFGTESWVAFRPEQIKSAIGNRGTFDPENPNILFSRRGPIDSTLSRFGIEREPESQSPFAAENARLREEDKTVWNKAKQFWRRQFFPGGLLPADVFKEKIARDNELEVVEFDVRHLIGKLERAIKQDYGVAAVKLTDAQQKTLSAALPVVRHTPTKILPVFTGRTTRECALASGLPMDLLLFSTTIYSTAV